MLTLHIGEAELHLQKGDITNIQVDAIVNAANSFLAGGGGVDGAIHRAGGPSIMQELDEIRARIGQCAAGHAVATGAGLLPAKFVFHAVGPIYLDGSHGEPLQLASCYTTCLNMAADRKLHSISFPSISTGVYGYPVEKAAAIALDSVRQWLQSGLPTSLKVVRLVQFSDRDYAIYSRRASAFSASG